MPTSPKTICPRCGRATKGRCGCTPKVDTRDRQEQHRRNVVYGRQWKAFRMKYLTEHPLCVDCEEAGRLEPANEVHHRAKVKDEPELQYDCDNLMALCKTCHNARTARGE